MRAHVLLCSTLLACGGSTDLEPVEMTDAGGEVCLERGDDGELDFRCGFQLVRSRVVDLLFVIDDGPEAGALQARLADSMDELAAGIDALPIQPELRIGFTSSRDANPECTAEGEVGRLSLASCRERPDAFIDPSGADRFAELCASRCDLGELATTPTSLAPGETLASRPWIETFEGRPNLPDGVGLDDALRCASLLGTTDCPFPAPFAATRHAFLRADEDDEPQYGFIRDEAPTIVVWVGTGAECSLGPAGSAAFDANGSRTLWSDPELATPGLCWNGGVACSDTDAGALDCVVQDRNEVGELATPDTAVLAPSAEIAEFLGEVNDWHLQFSPVAELRVFAIGGVPPDWTEGPIPVLAPADEITDRRYAVQPTCMVDGDAMLPPVRHAAALETRELAETGAHAMLSACTDDFGPYMAEVVEAIDDAMVPTCNPSCAADVDPETDGLQVDCRVEAEFPAAEGGIETLILVECEHDDDGDPVIPAGERACMATRTDAAMSEKCRAEGWNLEFDLLWDGPTPPGTSFKPSCTTSQDKERDCPDL